MFFERKKSRKKLVEALSVLAAALDNPRKPNKEIYIKAALFTGSTFFMDFLGYRTKTQIFQSHE